MVESNNILKTGTTTLGMVFKDGIILAADRRATSGNFIAQKKTQKVHVLNDCLAVTIAGVASDAQLLVKLGRSEVKLKALRTGRPTTVKEAANMMSRLVYSNIRKMSMIPGISHFLLGGKDHTGFHLYDIFADGSLDELQDFVSSGSGSVMAYGVLETLYKPNMSLNDAISLALKSINAALQRDSASGNGVDVYSITESGIKQVVDKDLTVNATI